MAVTPATDLSERERAQIVRDLHDLVLHRVSEVRVHATALGTLTDDRGRASVEAILLASSEALAELRRMHAVIDPDQTIAYAPLPDLEALQALLDAERPARLPRVRAPEGVAVPAGVAAGCYRLAQELLRAVHGALGVTLADARLAVAGAWLELRLELCGGAPDLRRAAVRAAALGGTLALEGQTVLARLPLMVAP